MLRARYYGEYYDAPTVPPNSMAQAKEFASASETALWPALLIESLGWT